MKVHLRNLETGAFFKTENTWTAILEQAFDFGTDASAFMAAKELGLKNVDMIFATDGQMIFGMPVKLNGLDRLPDGSAGSGSQGGQDRPAPG